MNSYFSRTFAVGGFVLVSTLALVGVAGCGGGGGGGSTAATNTNTGSSSSSSSSGSSSGGSSSSSSTSSATTTVGGYTAVSLASGVSIVSGSPSGGYVVNDNGVPGYIAAGSSTVKDLTGSQSVTAINDNSAMIGTAGAYWSSPSASPTTLPALSGDTTYALTSINDSGAIVGLDKISATSYVPVYYSSPSATPVALSLTGISAGVTLYPVAINNSGEIIGVAVSNSSLNAVHTYAPYVWATPTSAPVALTLPSGDTGGQVAAINASGEIVGASWPSYSGSFPASEHAVVWTSYSAQPTKLSGLSGATFVAAYSINSAGVIAGLSSTAIGTVSGIFINQPLGSVVTWTAGTHNVSDVDDPSNSFSFSNSEVLSNTGVIGDSGVILYPPTGSSIRTVKSHVAVFSTKK